MPKDTFHNLPEEKKKRIVESAVAEFVDFSFDQASTNRIIELSGISKGSFYQYFDDKKDLYKYVIKLLGEEKMKYVTPVLLNPFNHQFFEVIHDTFQSGIQFARENPDYFKIGVRLMQNKDHPIYIEIMGENKNLAIAYYKKLLEMGISSGELREDIDLEFIASLIYNMSLYIVEYDINQEIDDLEKQVIGTLDKLMDLIANGIQNKEG